MNTPPSESQGGQDDGAGNGDKEPATHSPKPADEGRRQVKRAAFLIAGIVVAIILAFFIWRGLTSGGEEGVLEASGRIEGRMTTLVAKISGRVEELISDEGDMVARNDILAILDDEAQRERVRAAAAQLRAIKERLKASELELERLAREITLRIEQTEAALVEVKAKLDQAQANKDQAERDAARYSELAARGVVPQQRAEDERLKETLAKKSLVEANAAVARAERTLDLAHLDRQTLAIRRAERDALEREIARAEASLAEQQSYIDEFTIKSPLDGTVLTRTIELGERVNAGTPLFTLVDLNRLYVKVYIREPDIGKIALNQPAEVYVDAYPERAFPARVSRVAQQAEFTPKNVETKEERVKLVFAVELSLMENPGGILKPGMPADTFIKIAGVQQDTDASGP